MAQLLIVYSQKNSVFMLLLFHGGNVKGKNFRNPTSEGSSHTPDAHQQQHTAVTLVRAALNICILKYLSSSIQVLLQLFPISFISESKTILKSRH